MREEDFPELLQEITYLDNACMSLRPESVIEKVEEYYREYPGCPGRSNHSISEKVGSEIQKARKEVANLIDASSENLVLTSGTTESINTVAKGLDYRKAFLSDREHNSNLLPWQSKDLKIIDTSKGLNISKLESELQENDLVSIVHVSNLDGYEIPVKEVSKIVRDKGAYLMIDAAQSVPHQSFSVKELKPDFAAFSGHKMLGPSGTGGLYVSDRVKDSVQPLTVGGGSVNTSTYTDKRLKDFPHSMESGLPNVAGILGFGTAASYLTEIGMPKVEKHEKELSKYFRKQIRQLDDVELLNPKYDGVFSLNIEGMDSHEISLHMDKRDIAVRSGQHCVHPYFEQLTVEDTLRISFHLYNNKKDVRKAVKALKEISYLS